MASIRKELTVAAHPDAVWDAVRDFGALHERLVPGFVTETRLDADDRLVTFFDGNQARERLVAIDDERRRLVYAVVDSALDLDHHQASVEIVDGPSGGSRLIWTTDVLPDEVVPVIHRYMEQGAAAIAHTLDS